MRRQLRNTGVNLAWETPVFGALLILAALLAQAERLQVRSRMYLLLNVVGAAILTADAFVRGEPGFLLLEGIWALTAAAGLLRPLVGGRAAGERRT